MLVKFFSRAFIALIFLYSPGPFAVASAAPCSAETQTHLDLAMTEWKDYKVYLLDSNHSYPDASDVPAAEADEKGIQHELGWIDVNGKVSDCRQQALEYYLVKSDLDQIYDATHFYMTEHPVQQMDPSLQPTLDAAAQQGLINSLHDFTHDVSMLYRYHYDKVNPQDYARLKQAVKEDFARAQLPFQSWEQP